MRDTVQWELAEAALEHAVAARAEVEDAAEQLEGLQSEAAAARELANHTASELQVLTSDPPPLLRLLSYIHTHTVSDSMCHSVSI